MNLGQGQDWNDVVLSKRHTGAAASASKNVRAAQQSGAVVDTSKKYSAGGNSQATTGTGVSAQKLDNETEDFTIERVPTELKKQILQGRLAKKMTQVQLAQIRSEVSICLEPVGGCKEQLLRVCLSIQKQPWAVNEKPNVIQEYECGKAIPNPQILQKMSRILGVPLSKTGGGGKAPAKPTAKAAAKPGGKQKKNPTF